MSTVHSNQSLTYAKVILAIQEKALTPAAMAILLYTLSVMQPGCLVVYDHVSIGAILGIKRTSFFNAIRCLKQRQIISKQEKNTYVVDIQSVLPKGLTC